VWHRVSLFRLNFFFAQCEMEAKRKPFRMIFASFCETNDLIFRMFSLRFAPFWLAFCYIRFKILTILLQILNFLNIFASTCINC
jgi:hypothetical protein